MLIIIILYFILIKVYSFAFNNIWVNTSAPQASWFSIASSSDGLNLAAAQFGGYIVTSSNGNKNYYYVIDNYNFMLLLLFFQ